MSEMNIDLENMSSEELDKLQSMISVAKTKKQLGSKYRIHQAIEQLVEYVHMPERYQKFITSLEELESVDIVPTVLTKDTILRFPTLMVLAAWLPRSEIDLRCGLVELFDSYVYHSDFGLIVSNLAPFDVDRALSNCRAHDPAVARMYLEEFYRKLSSLLNNPISEGESRIWIRKALDDVMFILHVIYGENLRNLFSAAVQFMLPTAEACNLFDDKEHAKFVDKVNENGSDMLYSKRIASCFKLN